MNIRYEQLPLSPGRIVRVVGIEDIDVFRQHQPYQDTILAELYEGLAFYGGPQSIFVFEKRPGAVRFFAQMGVPGRMLQECDWFAAGLIERTIN